jgi:hypothetical protein
LAKNRDASPMTSHTFRSLVSFCILNTWFSNTHYIILTSQIQLSSNFPSFPLSPTSTFNANARIGHHAKIKKFSCQTSPRLGSRKDKAIRIDKCTQSRQIRPLLFEQLAQVLIVKDNITNTLLKTPIQVSLPLPLLRYPPKDSPFLTFTFATFTQTPRWHIQTGLPRMTGYCSANSQKLFPIKIWKWTTASEKPAHN